MDVLKKFHVSGGAGQPGTKVLLLIVEEISWPKNRCPCGKLKRYFVFDMTWVCGRTR
jgi:hypothetical protein